ncbi:MAG: hypothetical protein KatS3mg096_776 [Candidatus Parcubacteria bacterium]|nr:MAG: hypothetical protein KatS3mg096_776 [Candidatus Parcubacteria bacterium]
MPAKSKAQHGFMALVRRYKETGRVSDIDNPEVKEKVKEAAENLSMSQIRDFLKTKIKKLPQYVVSKKAIKS